MQGTLGDTGVWPQKRENLEKGVDNDRESPRGWDDSGQFHVAGGSGASRPKSVYFSSA